MLPEVNPRLSVEIRFICVPSVWQDWAKKRPSYGTALLKFREGYYFSSPIPEMRERSKLLAFSAI